MNALRFASLSLLLLFGCNDSSVPLGPAETAPMDYALAAYWEPVDQAQSEENGHLLIIPFNEHEYYVLFFDPEEFPEESAHLRGFITEIDDLTFANLQPLTGEPEPEDYFIYQLELSGDDILTVKFVDHDMDHIKTSEELRTFVQTVVDNDAFEAEDIIRFRKIELD